MFHNLGFFRGLVQSRAQVVSPRTTNQATARQPNVSALPPGLTRESEGSCSNTSDEWRLGHSNTVPDSQTMGG